MHIVFAACSASGETLDKLHERFASIADSTIPFAPADIRVQRGQQTLIISYECSNPLFTNGSYATKAGEAVAFCGTPLIDLGRSYDSTDVLEAFKGKGAAGFRKTTGGSYSVVSANDDRLVCFSDICGRYPLFWKRMHGCTVVCNLPRLLGLTAGSDVSMVPRAARSLLVHSQLWGGETLFPGVRLIEPRFGLLARSSGSRLFPLDDECWNNFGCATPLGPRQYEDAANALLGSFRALGHLASGRRLTLGLSGGKDSRVMAAYAIAAGLRDRVAFFTGGMHGSPEFDVAAMVAEALQTKTEFRPSNPGSEPPGRTYEKLRFQVGRYDGMLLPLAGDKDPHRSPPRVEVTGFGGELYRRGIGKQFVSKPLRSWDDARTRWKSYHVPQDALGIARASTKLADSDWMAGWVDDRREEGLPLQCLPELFFSSYRVPLHQGLATIASGVRLSVDPLIHPLIQKVHNSFGAYAGEAEMTHASLLWHADRSLLALPFLKDRWSAAVLPKFNGFALATTPVAAGVSDRAIRPFDWNFFAEGHAPIQEIFRSPAAEPLFEWIDRDLLLGWLEDGASIQSTPQVNQAFTTFGIAVRLAGQHVIPRDNANSAPPRVHGDQGWVWKSGAGRDSKDRCAAE